MKMLKKTKKKKNINKQTIKLIKGGNNKEQLVNEIDVHFRKFDNELKSDKIVNELTNDISNHLETTNEKETLFCHSLNECTDRLLNMIGYKNLTSSIKNKIDDTIYGLSHLLQLSFLESIKMVITTMGIIAFSISGLEKLYKHGDNITSKVSNYFSSSVNTLGEKISNSVSNLSNIDASLLLKKIKSIIMNNKVIISLSTIIMVITSIKACSKIRENNGIKDFKEINFNDILLNYFDFYPFTTTIGKTIIEYTALFMDSSRKIVNKLLKLINSICMNNMEFYETQILLDKRSIVTKYMKHQRITIEYMTNKCTNQSGIYLYHFTGSGKSVTSLGIAQNLGLPTIIICPISVLNQWKTDVVPNYQEKMPEIEEILNYSDGYELIKKKDKSWFEHRTLIFDEAHNIVTLDYKNNFLSKMMQFGKKIVLSATPMYENTSDIGYILNLTSGKYIFPNDEQEFRRKYYKIRLAKSFFHGWIRSSLISYNNIFRIISPLLLYSIPIESFITTININNTLTEIFLINKKQLYYYTINMNPFMLFIKLIGKDSGRNAYINGMTIFMNKLLDFYEKIREKKPEKIVLIINMLTNWLDGANIESINKGVHAIHAMTLPFIIIIFTIISYGIHIIFSDAKTNDGKEEYLEIDNKKISKNIGRYVSFYEPDKTSTYPTVIHKLEYVGLNSNQTGILMKYILANLSMNEYLSMNIIEHEKDYDKISFNQKDKKLMKIYGPIIGNICILNNVNTNKIEYDYTKSLKFIKSRNIYSLISGHKFINISPKFIKVQDILNNNKNKRIIIYSNYGVSSKLLSAYLHSISINHYYISQNITSNEKNKIFNEYYGENTKNNVSVIILDENYYEGLSILMTDIFIILDNSSSTTKNTQLEGRVVRLDSHKNKEEVQIIKLVSDLSNINVFSSKMKEWIGHHFYTFYEAIVVHHQQNITPDMINYMYVKNRIKDNNNFISIIKKSSIENFNNNTIPTDCEEIDCDVKEINENSECALLNQKKTRKKKI